MKKIMILFMPVLGMTAEAFAFTSNELQNTKKPTSELYKDPLFLLVIVVLFFIFIWAIYDWGWLKRNGFFKRKKKWIFEDFSFLNRNPNKKPKTFNPTKDMFVKTKKEQKNVELHKIMGINNRGPYDGENL